MAATAIKMPKLGMTMREGTVVRWPFELGEHVEAGQIVLVIESEKAEVEIDAGASGFLRHVYVEPGETVPCGSLLAVMTHAADEALDVEAFRREHDTPEGSAGAARGAATSGATSRGAGAPGGAEDAAATVRVARAAGASSESAAQLSAKTGPDPVFARRAVAPAARARARELGIDIDAVAGSGPGGRVVRADVDAYVAARASLVSVAAGVSLEVPSSGAGETVLFLPGFGTDASSFAPQTRAFAADYRVRVMNPRGIGGSDAGADDAVTPQLVAADAAALLDGPAHVVGASFGAYAALELALARPDLIRTLVLITPALAWSPHLLAVLDSWTRLIAEAAPETVAAAMLPWLFSGEYLADAAQAQRTARGFAAMVRRTPAPVLARYAAGLRLRFSQADAALERIVSPTLVLTAERDLLTPDAARVAEDIPGARLVVIERAGHAVALEAGDAVTRAIREQLRAQ